MAQVIQTLCDVCLSRDESVNADSFTITIQGTTSVIDLCPADEGELLGQLQQVLGDLGRPESRRLTLAGSEGSQAHRYTCRFCGRGYTSRSGVATHERREHADIYLTGPSDFPCPECQKPFDTRRGLGIHRRAEHGVKSPATQRSSGKAPNGRRRKERA